MAFTFEDIGACNCSATCPSCLPCPLPAANLSYTGSITLHAISGTLTYLGSCTWSSGCQVFFGAAYQIDVGCTGGVSTYRFRHWSLGPGVCSGAPDIDVSYSSAGGGALSLVSYNCSSLSIHFDNGGFPDFTIT
jgi:hypothetical protein